MMTGRVRSYSDRKGFGFIELAPGEGEVYFHVSTCRGKVAPPLGADVRFHLVRGNRGPQAAHVELVTLDADVLKGKDCNG